MDSGKQLWKKKADGAGGDENIRYYFVQGFDGKVAALKYQRPFFDPNSKRPFSLVTFDLKTGAEDSVQDFSGFGESLGTFQAGYVHDGRLFMATVSNEGTLMAKDGCGHHRPGPRLVPDRLRHLSLRPSPGATAGGGSGVVTAPRRHQARR